MAVYTFFLHNSRGIAFLLDAADLPKDADASERAQKLLLDHDSCAYVTIWEAERRLPDERTPV